jgi:nucleotide-binding universal stress UspA family protein
MAMPTQPGAGSRTGPILFAYDGSDLAGFAIEQAAEQLVKGRDALVICVWQPVDVGFMPTSGRHFDADQATDVRSAAEETAAHGASLATRAGFRPQSMAVEAAPTWKGIVDTAEQRDASVIVVGSHRHAGLMGHFHGNVAAAVLAHAALPVLVVHPRP